MQVLSEEGAALLQMLPEGAGKDSGIRGCWAALLRQNRHELELQKSSNIEMALLCAPSKSDESTFKAGGSWVLAIDQK